MAPAEDPPVRKMPGTRLDHSWALFRDPYRFISNRCRKYGSEVFQTRLLLQRTICMSGPEAGELFYDPERFVRRGAMPGRVQKTLFGRGGVQGLDGRAHRHRKEMFMALMEPQRVRQLAEHFAAGMREAIPRWSERDQVVFYNELHPILTQAVCDWAGVPVAESELSQRSSDLMRLFDGNTPIGPQYWWSRYKRIRANRWAEGIIKEIRAGRLSPPAFTAAHLVATHKDLDGQLLDTRTAAVELLNVLRPVVATSVYLTFAAHALHVHSQWREKLRQPSELREAFVQEVRRHYPFFPAVMAVVKDDFRWKGYRFPAGTRVIFDLYGTNHEPAAWRDPEEFSPTRFCEHAVDSPAFVPQGGGDHHRNHRCPGEAITIEVMKACLSVLLDDMAYRVPEQDLRMDLTRLPGLPHDRFIIADVSAKSEAATPSESA